MEEETQAQQTATEPELPPRRYRWIYLLVGALVLLLGLTLVGWFAVLPKVVENRLKDSLKELGFSEVELQVDQLGMSRARLSGIRLGGGRPIVIGEVMVEYRLREVMDGVLLNVVVEGLELEALQEAGGVRFPQLEQIRLPRSEEPLRVLPFESIRFENSALVLTEKNGEAKRIPFSISLNKSLPLEMAIEVVAREHEAEGRAMVEFLEGKALVRKGQLSWKDGTVSLPTLASPLTQVSLALSFEGEIGGEADSVSILPGSRISARTELWSGEDGIEASELALALSVTGDPWMLNESGLLAGGCSGKVAASRLHWANANLELTVRDGAAEVFIGANGLKVRVLPGTELDWRPSEAFLAARGVVADGVQGTLRELEEPAELDFPERGDWSVVIPRAQLDVRGGLLSMGDGNFTADSLAAAINIRADIGAGRGSIHLNSGSTLETGTIRHRVFEDVSPVVIQPALCGLSAAGAKPTVSWSDAEGFELNLNLSSDEIAARQGGLRLSAVPMDLGIKAVPSEVSVEVAGRTRALVTPDRQWLIGQGVNADELRVTARDFSGPILLQRTITGDTWILETPRLWLDMKAKSLEVPKAGLSLDSLETSLRVKADFDEQGPIVNLQSPAELIAGAVKISGDTQAFEVEAERWLLTPDVHEPELELMTQSDGGVGIVLNGRLDGTNVHARAHYGKVGFKRIAFVGRFSDEQAGGLRGHVGLMGGLLESNGTGFALDEVGAKFALDGDQWSGNFTVGETRVKEIVLPAIQGRALSEDGGIRFSASGELIEDVNAELDGRLAGDTLRAKLRVPPTLITDAQALGHRFGFFNDLEINGTAGMDMDVNRDSSGQVELHTRLTLQDAAVASADLGVIADGISGAVNLHGTPARLMTKSSQRIKVRRARLGMLDLVNGVTDFQVNSDGLLVDAESWSLALDPEGRFRARDIRLVAGQPVSTVVEVDRLDLGIWLGLLTGGKVEATGKLSGRVPVTLTGRESNLPLRVEDGAILKTVGPGKLQFKSAQWAGEWLESVDPRFKSDPLLMQLRQGVVEALQDFTYSSIQFSYDANADRMQVMVNGEGKTKGGRVVKFEPTINIQPVASWINESYNELVLLAHLENLVSRDLDALFGD